MGLLLPQKVNVIWNNMNRQHLINKGYVYTFYKDKININVLDLPDKSAIEVKVVCDYCGEKFERKWIRVKPRFERSSKISCGKCKCRDMEHTRLSNDDYCNKLIGYTVVSLEKYIKSNVEIKHKCLLCDNTFSAEPNRVLSAIRLGINCCSHCNKLSVSINCTDLWATHPSIASLLENPEDGHKYRFGSQEKVNWRCNDCGSIIRGKNINNVVKNGLSCSVCGDSFSIGFKFVCGVLNELGVDFETEKSFDWLKNRYYDVFVPEINMICEIHGSQHYTSHGFGELGGRSLEDEIENDNLKLYSAMSNGISSYIIIDARESNFEFLKQSVMDSDLHKIYDFSKIDFEAVYTNSLSSYIIKVCELWNSGLSVSKIRKIMKLSDTTVQRYLHICTEINLCKYGGIEEKFKPIVCLNTKERFINLDEAAKKYGINPNNISHVCQGIRNRRYAGRGIDGVKLQWMFADEYDTKSEEEIDSILITKYKKPILSNHKVICLDTLEVFDSLISAKLKYNAPSISDCCRGFCNYTGYHPKLKIRLRWKYYDDYLLMTGSGRSA